MVDAAILAPHTALAHDVVEGLAVHDGEHVVRLKWHRMKRRVTDIPFTPRILAEAMALGASSEVDLRVHAEDGFAVLHDDTLDRETSGTGPVRLADIEMLRDLVMRTPEGEETDATVLLLDDLARLAAESAAPGALVQLDLKEDAPAITDAVVARFAALLQPVAGRFILSGGDIAAVTRLASAVPGLAYGYDPCDEAVVAALATTDDLERFVADAVATAGAASTIYLAYPLVLKAETMGVDMIAGFHAAGKLVDCWTLNSCHPEAERSFRRLVALKADQVTTDEPLLLASLYAKSDSSQG